MQNQVEQVFLISSDGQLFDVTMNIVRKFLHTIQFLCEELGYDENDKLPLPHVRGDILRRVLEWCEHHQHEVDPLDNISEWDQEILQRVIIEKRNSHNILL